MVLIVDLRECRCHRQQLVVWLVEVVVI